MSQVPARRTAAYSAAEAWPATAAELAALQERLATVRPAPWQPAGAEPYETPAAPAVPGVTVAGCFACLPRGITGRGAAGDAVWAAAAALRARRWQGRAVARGEATAPYIPGLLALRTGPALAAAVRALPRPPEVLLVDATGYDHPRRAGLAVHLGAVLDLPTVGVTHRTLLATGDWPADAFAATSPLYLDGRLVGYWLRSRVGRRPVAVHAGWRVDPDIAVRLVLAVTRRQRTPLPLREARRLARQARAHGLSLGGPAGRTGEEHASRSSCSSPGSRLEESLAHVRVLGVLRI